MTQMISPEDLWHLTGTPDCPIVIDARTDEDFDANPSLIPTALRMPGLDAAKWADRFSGQDLVVYCHKGLKISQGAAAWLRQAGAQAKALTGGFVEWHGRGLPLVPIVRLSQRDASGRTVWITGERPKIDRIACSWLIRRFVDPRAVFLFVEPDQVTPAAERFDATPFDVESAFWSHDGEHCTFDRMVGEFGLKTDAMRRLAKIVRGAETARPELASEAAGLLAVSSGLARTYPDDLVLLEQSMRLYDAFYRWARDVAEETHNWPAQAAGA